MMKTKTFTAPMELKKDGEPGEFKAIFATLNVIDHDRDVTVSGAFKEQPTIVEPWNHGWNLPAGKGVIKADSKKAWIEGQFFLDTEAGKENYTTVKNLGDLVEWSYTFNIEDADRGLFDGEEVNFLRSLDVVGVAPVTRGAGIGTQTITIKSLDELKKWTDDVKDEAGDGKSRDGDQETSGDDEDEAGDGKSRDIELMRTRIDILEIELLED
jgi:hypothetical protein